MRILCIVLPPLAVYLNGTPLQTVGNVFLSVLFWIPGVIHAWLVVSRRQRDDELRLERQLNARREAAWDADHPAPTPAPPPGWSVSPPAAWASEPDGPTEPPKPESDSTPA